MRVTLSMGSCLNIRTSIISDYLPGELKALHTNFQRLFLSLAINNGVNTTPKEQSRLHEVLLTAGLLMNVFFSNLELLVTSDTLTVLGNEA